MLNTNIGRFSPAERFRLCLALGNSRDTTLVERLQPLIIDSSALVRSGAAFALGLLPCKQSSQILRQRLSTENDLETLQQLVLSAGRIGNSGNIQTIINRSQFNKIRPVFLKSAVTFFSRGITPERIVSDCFTAMAGPNKFDRQAAAIVLFRIRQNDLVRSNLNAILPLSESPDPFIRYAVARLLKEVDFPQKNSLFRRFAGDPDWRVRYETTLTIPVLGGFNDVWQKLIDDENVYVSATALENPPPDYLPPDSIRNKIRRMLSSDHPMIRDAAGFFIISQRDSVYNSIKDSLINTNTLSPKGVTALCEQIGDFKRWEYIFNQSKNPVKSISTAAYMGLVNNVDTLTEQNIIPIDQRNQLILSGLDSKDPVQIYLAADYLGNSQSVGTAFNTQLYRCLKLTKYQYLDAQLAVISAIAKIKPEDAPKHLSSLLNSRQPRLRDAAYHALVDSFKLKVMPPISGPDVSLYRDLTRIKKVGLNPIVRLETTRGTIDIQCNAFYAPYTVDAFLASVKQNFYTGVVFHRVVPNFVIQAGDPRGDGWGGPDYHLRTERSPISFETGMVGMASAGPDTEGSQFFITTSPQYHLDTNYTLFGKVVRGMDTVNKIEIGDKILSARIIKPS